MWVLCAEGLQRCLPELGQHWLQTTPLGSPRSSATPKPANTLAYLGFGLGRERGRVGDYNTFNVPCVILGLRFYETYEAPPSPGFIHWPPSQPGSWELLATSHFACLLWFGFQVCGWEATPSPVILSLSWPLCPEVHTGWSYFLRELVVQSGKGTRQEVAVTNSTVIYPSEERVRIHCIPTNLPSLGAWPQECPGDQSRLSSQSFSENQTRLEPMDWPRGEAGTPLRWGPRLAKVCQARSKVWRECRAGLGLQRGYQRLEKGGGCA